MAKKFTAIILTLAMLLSAFAIPAAAATEVTSDVERGFYRFVDGLLDAVVTGISYMIVEPRGWATVDTYESKNFYEGNDFIDEPVEGAVDKDYGDSDYE